MPCSQVPSAVAGQQSPVPTGGDLDPLLLSPGITIHSDCDRSEEHVYNRTSFGPWSDMALLILGTRISLGEEIRGYVVGPFATVPESWATFWTRR